MKHFSHLNTAAIIVSKYTGSQPFHLFIKDFFRQYKKYGSKDRKQITQLCYCYFRLGQTVKSRPLQDAITGALFLCVNQHNELLAAVKPSWNEKTTMPVEEKCALLDLPFDALKIFPSLHELSDGIDTNSFNLSHLKQPDVFLRVRPGYQQPVIDKLTKAGVEYSLVLPHCISMPATTKVEELLLVNKEVVIQDYSSQRTGQLMQLMAPAHPDFTAWDCCAASGGKSIMAKDILGNIDLTVSDIRPLALAHLTKRFNEAGINNYHLTTADLTKPVRNPGPNSFDLIIADVPCTGSGTWGRTPERLTFFNKKEIDSYSQLQKKIVTSAMPCLKNNGYFLYITCSVFKKENEDAVDFIRNNLSAELVKMEVLKGYDMKADTMFAALLKKRI